MTKNDPKTGILFITPPFTQLNTPYPATACLKGFMNAQNIVSHQSDLGIGVILALFSPEGFSALFSEIDRLKPALSANARRMIQMRDEYTGTIGPVISFLQGRNPELAHLVCSGRWLPEAARFGQMTDLDRDFGHLGIHDRAKYLATLYLDDISDMIAEAVDPCFGFSRYAERLAMSASTSDELQKALNGPGSFIDALLTRLLKETVGLYNPTLVSLTVPFPGNLYGALKCGQWLKKNHPEIKVAMGGGFVNTELRSLADRRVFDYVDFITLDDGEAPLLNLVRHLEGQIARENLKRTFTRVNGAVTYFDGATEPDVAQEDAGTPDYAGLPMDKYLSVIEMANPMHRLWSDGRWNKLMLAHGCYWGRCTFCDVTLDYIKRYEPNTPATICDRMETIMAQTGHHGFHFTDEAAPPALLRGVALEILRRNLTVVWWTNIRFEKTYTPDLCFLLKKSGCIAVSGGLEVASDRILKMINKGVTVTQVARVAGNFTRAGIMVHAYLMYGFPTQTAQETIDSLEVVRQLFLNGIVQSGFWHQFAMTAHSPVGQNPNHFGVDRENLAPGSFTNNSLIAIDRTGCDHEAFGEGLKKSLYNYMHGICFDFSLHEWFSFRTPRTTVAPDFIRNILSHEPPDLPLPHSRIIWLGGPMCVTFHVRNKKGKTIQAAKLTIQSLKQEITLNTAGLTGKWLKEIFPLLTPGNFEPVTYSRMEELFKTSGLGDFGKFWDGPVVRALRENGLVVV
ncbi:MAG TPA: radical SAM protein [Bacteroidales bacterium]|nr:radical SAM protein [Bacteroidales bacterium]